MSKKKIVIPVVLLLLAGGGAAWRLGALDRFEFLGFAAKSQEDGDLTLFGNVDIRQVELGFRVAGRLEAIHFDEGDRVTAGTVLARIDSRPYDDTVRQAEAQVAAQRAVVEKLEAGARPAEIAQQRALVAERQADLANATEAFERQEQLRRSGSASQAAFDQAKAAKDIATARLASAREALRLIQEGSRVEDVRAARATLEGAKAQLAAAQTALADTKLVAPSDGIIQTRVREAGAIVSPGDVVYVLSLVRPVWVRIYIAEPHLGRIHPGMEVSVTTDTDPDKVYRGKIGFISPVAEFTPKSVETPELRTELVYRVRVVVDGEDATGLRQGMPVTVRVPINKPAQS